MTITVSAPGKTILMGEHAAVYGRPALVAAVDRRLRATVGPPDGPGDGWTLELPDLGIREEASPQDLLDHARTCREAWEAWAADPAVGLGGALGNGPAHLVKIAMGEALGRWVSTPTAGRLTVTSDVPLGSGFGSSAAASVAVGGALMAAGGRPFDAADLEAFSLDVERRQHGAPSGVDGGTVLRGGVLWAERSADGGALRLEPVDIRDPACLSGLRIYHSGPPAEATGEVVAAVRRLRDRDSSAFDRGLNRATAQTADLRRALESSAADPGAVISSFRGFQGWLESLGVVPEPVRAAVREVVGAGGAAKTSGAGSLSGPGAGSLLVFHPEPAALDALPSLGAFERLDLRLGAPGVRLEPPAAIGGGSGV
ncbi:MAG: hypothetical protein AAGD06_02990 [Acidobacteriota bacterium]